MQLSHPKNDGLFSFQSLVATILLWFLLAVPAQAATAIKVLLENNVNQVTVGSSTTGVVKNAQGARLGKLEGMTQLQATANQQQVQLGNWKSDQLWITPQDNGYVWIEDSWYRGKTQLVNQGSQLQVINQVHLEKYLYSVVGAEMKAHWPLPALKAQAVAARSYAVNKQQRSRNSLYDVTSTVGSQVYQGLATETSRTHQAVNETLGEVLTYGQEVILAVFHASSGGHTEDVEDVWNRSLPYLRGVVDYDQTAPVYQWQTTLSGQEIANTWELEHLKDIIPQQTTPQGRILNLKLLGEHQTKTISGEQFRQKLNLRSTLFEIVRKEKGNEPYFILSGNGFGHGVGLSQWGAYHLARKGANYRQILGHYYQEVKLSPIKPFLAKN